jgi:hypothetical protein
MTATRTLTHGLGILGLTPFVALAVLIAAAPTETPLLSRTLLYYGATILAFLGGVYWGLALRADESVDPAFLAFAVVPQLIGFGAMLLPTPLAHVLLGAALVGVLVIDAAYWKKNLMPRWFLPLRITLSLVAAISLFTAAAALSFRH